MKMPQLAKNGANQVTELCPSWAWRRWAPCSISPLARLTTRGRSRCRRRLQLQGPFLADCAQPLQQPHPRPPQRSLG